MRFTRTGWLLAAMLLFQQAYGRMDPKCPASTGEAGWLEQQMLKREEAVFEQRKRAIRLLKEFLASYPHASERAEALFRLAELHWEQAETEFLARMQTYDKQLQAFRSGQVPKRPSEPRIDLGDSLSIYKELLENHPNFQRIDMVMYLYGFGLNEQGNERTALAIYQTLLKRFPHSAFVPDAHLAIGEYHFSKQRFSVARRSYEQVLRYETPLLELALYKTAWCYFKEGQAKKAAARFRQVLDRASKQRERSPGRVHTPAASLEKEALEDLALTFSESGGAKEAYRFMKQVGGEDYSIGVLQSLGDVFFRQARYDRAQESFRILVERFPFAPDSPKHQEKIAEAYQREGKLEKAIRERRKLAEQYGPGSTWAKRNSSNQKALDHGLRTSEESLRFVATFRHNQAQKNKTRQAYLVSAQAYRDYLEKFGESQHAPKLHFYLGEVLYRLGQYDQAAVHYTHAVLKSDELGAKREAAYAIVLAYDQLRQKEKKPKEPPHQEQKLSGSEQAFVRAVDEFASLAPEDKMLPQLHFEVGKTYYFRGHYRRASKQFLELARDHSEHPFAQPAADLALDCFARTKNWAELESQARRFQKSKVFKGKDLGKKLPGFIAASVFQHASVLAESGKHREASREYRRLVEHFPKDKLAPKALLLAAVCLEQAGQKQQAIATYQEIVQRYPARAAEAHHVIAGVYERQYDYEKAAHHYVNFAQRFGSDRRSPDALLRAAMLYRARREYAKEARALAEFSRSYPRHEKAAKAMFLAGLALKRAKRYPRAERVFVTYLKKHVSSAGRSREANLHLGQIRLKMGRRRSARACFEACGSYPPQDAPRGPELAASAHCRFMLAEMVFDEYKKLKLRPPKKRLTKLLKQKAQILKSAEKLFTNVVAAGHMEWASAALYRIGDMYAQFSQAIYHAPLPRGLSAKELDAYRQQLQALAYPIEDKALSAFNLSHQMALKHGYYSRWTIKTMDRLRRLDPGKHPQEEELRPATEWADSFTTFPLILDRLPSKTPSASKEKRP